MRSETQAVYMIGVAAQLCNIHPQTLRQYERLGLINPQRAGAKNRLYSDSDIRRIKQREPRLETDIHEPRRLGDLGRAPRFEKIPAPAKRARAEAEHRHLEPRPTEIAIIHKE